MTRWQQSARLKASAIPSRELLTDAFTTRHLASTRTGTTATMIAVINNAVAGVGIAFLVRFLWPSAPSWLDVAAGIAGAVALTWLFYAYPRWRFVDYDVRARQRTHDG